MARQRKYPKEEKDGEIARLKKIIKRLTKEKEQLKSELRTLEAEREITHKYIDGKLDGIPVEKVIKSVAKNKKMAEVIKEGTPTCKKCGTVGMSVIRTPHNVTNLCKLCNHTEVIKNGQEIKRENN